MGTDLCLQVCPRTLFQRSLTCRLAGSYYIETEVINQAGGFPAMRRGKIRKMFPGSNSAYGFYSFYDQIIEDNATRIFVIKGGPGVGKSTFMQNIARELIKKGRDAEFHCCSAAVSYTHLDVYKRQVFLLSIKGGTIHR